MLTLLLTCALVPQGPSGAPVVINEFLYEDGGADDREFVELYNRSGSTVDITGWKIRLEFNGAATRADITISSTSGPVMLAAAGFFVIGDSVVPNVQITLPKKPSDYFLEPGALYLIDDQGMVVDSVAYDMGNAGSWRPTVLEGDGIWGHSIASDNQEFTSQRRVDGMDTDSNGDDFVLLYPWTPGQPNFEANAPLPYARAYNALAIGSGTVEFGRTVSFATIASPFGAEYNPSAVPRSPGGGNALSFWSTASQQVAVMNMFQSPLPPDVMFEAWIYIDANDDASPGGKLSQGGAESWTIAFGTTGSRYKFPPLPNVNQSSENGNTGIGWSFKASAADGVALYFCDFNDGGWGPEASTTPTVIGTIPIQAGVNDGWQKLRLQRDNGMIIGWFGGTVGCASGTMFSTPALDSAPTSLYVAYRESVSNNGDARPPLLDDCMIAIPTSSIRLFGTPSSTTAGTPMIGTLGPPALGHVGFGITLSGVVPSQSCFVMLGTQELATPISLATLGGPPGSALLIQGIATFSVPSSPAGMAVLPVPVPCTRAMQGLSVVWQGFDIDMALPYSIPLGNSAGLETIFGY